MHVWERERFTSFSSRILVRCLHRWLLLLLLLHRKIIIISSSRFSHHLIVSPKTQTNTRHRERDTHGERFEKKKNTKFKTCDSSYAYSSITVFAFPSLETQLLSECNAKSERYFRDTKNGQMWEKKTRMSDENNALLLKLLCVVEKGERGYKRAQKWCDDEKTKKIKRDATCGWTRKRGRGNESARRSAPLLCTRVNSGV